MTTPESLQEVLRDEYQTLHDVLKHARETGTDAAKTAYLRDQAGKVQAVLTSLDQADLRSRTAEFGVMGKHIASVNADMAALKAKIGQIVEDAAIANKIVNAIDSAASAAAKLFA